MNNSRISHPWICASMSPFLSCAWRLTTDSKLGPRYWRCQSLMTMMMMTVRLNDGIAKVDMCWCVCVYVCDRVLWFQYAAAGGKWGKGTAERYMNRSRNHESCGCGCCRRETQLRALLLLVTVWGTLPGRGVIHDYRRSGWPLMTFVVVVAAAADGFKCGAREEQR